MLTVVRWLGGSENVLNLALGIGRQIPHLTVTYRSCLLSSAVPLEV